MQRWSELEETRAPRPGSWASPGAVSTRASTASPHRRKATAKAEDGVLADEPDELVPPPLEEALRPGAGGRDHQLARILGGFHQDDLHRVRRRGAWNPVHPLDQRGSGSIAQLVEPRPIEVDRAREAVQVCVGQQDASVMLVDDGEGRAGHVLVPEPHPAGDAPGELGLPRSQISHQAHEVTVLEHPPQRLPERAGLLGRRGGEAHRPHAVHTSPSAAVRSDAMSPRRPQRRAAASPASPCASTPTLAASSGDRPWARKAPTIPESTSPVPPVAMPGLPVGFTRTCPFGSATTERAPLSTTTARWVRAKAVAVAIRCVWTSATVLPARRAISPGWGVRTTGARLRA